MPLSDWLTSGFLSGLLLAIPLLGLTTAAANVANGAERLVCYISVGGENRIAIYHVDPKDGSLTAAGNATLKGAPGSLALSPDRKVLYAADRTNGHVVALRIDQASGALTPIQSTPVASNPVYIAVDHSGRYLLTTYYSADKIAIYPIREDGSVDAQATQILEAEDKPHSILMDARNQAVLVPNCGSHGVLQFRFDAKTGKLTPSQPARVDAPEGTGPRHVIYHPEKNFVYVVNETNSSVTAYRFDPENATLEALQTLSTLPEGFDGKKNSCADIEITPDGKFVFASNRGHDSLAGFAVQPDGRLKAIGHTPTEQTPREFAIDPSGRFVYSAGQGSGKLASYRLDPATGKLEQFAVTEVGKSPAWVLVVKLPGAKSE